MENDGKAVLRSEIDIPANTPISGGFTNRFAYSMQISKTEGLFLGSLSAVCPVSSVTCTNSTDGIKNDTAIERSIV
jgi:hypothetical protein